MAVSPRSSEESAKNRTKAIREWAIGEGLEVSSRGRISAEIERAFHDAAAKKVRIEAEPAKKAVSRKAPVKRATASKAPAKKTVDVEKVVAETTPAKNMTKEIREWAIGQGLDVSSRGRISAE
ncbi:Lsr2 family DNA-binding protein, partial [Rhodococcus oxybenzonivorans]